MARCSWGTAATCSKPETSPIYVNNVNSVSQMRAQQFHRKLIRTGWGLNSIYLKCTEYKVIQDTINSVGKGASFIKAQVKNKSFSALVDSGAAVSMISRHFADETGSPWTATVHNTAYYSAGMNPLQVVGEVQVRVELGGTFFDEKFLVTNNLSQRMIIGGDVLRKNKIDILFSNREIRLNGTKIPMITVGSETIGSVTEEFRPSDLVCIRIA